MGSRFKDKAAQEAHMATEHMKKFHAEADAADLCVGLLEVRAAVPVAGFAPRP